MLERQNQDANRLNKFRKQETNGYYELKDQERSLSKKSQSRNRSPVSAVKDTSTENTLNLLRVKKPDELSVSPKSVRYSARKSEDSSRQDSIGPSNGSTVHDEVASRYECIANITEQENVNLKEQNAYLLEKLRKMKDRQQKMKHLYDKAKKYKVLWEEAQLQIKLLKDECIIYQQQAEQMKKIMLTDLFKLKQKVIQTEILANDKNNTDSYEKFQNEEVQTSATFNQPDANLLKYLE